MVQEKSVMLRFSLVSFLTCAACAVNSTASRGEVKLTRIFDAHILQSEYGAAIEDLDCPSGGIKITVDSSLQGSEFLKVLRYGGGSLGPAAKYVVIDGVVQTTGELGDDTEVTLVRVNSIREEAFNPQKYMELSEANLGCENDLVHQRAWLASLKRKSRDR